MNIIRAIVGGEQDIHKLSAFHNPQMKASKEELGKALQGNWKREHLFALQQALTCYDFFKAQMVLCEKEIERSLDELNGGDGSSSIRKGRIVRQNDYSFQADIYLSSLTGVDLTAIDGLDEKTIITIVSETGTNLNKWKSARHFSSWLGLAPRPKVSGEKTLGHFKQSVAGRAGKAFRAAAATMHHNKSHLGAFYRKLAYRKGSFAALKATARKLAVIFWNMMTTGKEYRKEEATSYEQKQQVVQLRRLEKQAAKFGLTLQKINEQRIDNNPVK
jgi:transposase